MQRWTASFLALVMLVPAFGPLALAGTVAPGMHCVHHPLQTPEATQPAMHCRHAMAAPPQPGPVSTSFNAIHSCCDNHDCCCRLKTSEWARPAGSTLKFVHLLVEPALPLMLGLEPSSDPADIDSARAPPHS